MVTANASARCLGAGAGLLLDRVLGEPPTPVHPVAGFGSLMQQVEHVVYRDATSRGLLFTIGGTLLGVAAGRAVRSTSAAVALTASGRMLRSTAHEIAGHLVADDLPAAREALSVMVGRDRSTLDQSGVAAAVIESLAENTVDAVVAPALWGAAFGAPGAAAHRAINTMDAMVGHRSPRYLRFGTAAARLDDVAAYLPTRATAVLVCMSRPARARLVVDTVLRDAAAHPSPNAGVAEAAFAAALGLELGGPLRYNTRVEERPRLGRGPRPCPRDIASAIQLADRVELLLVGILVTTGLVTWPASKQDRQ
jgi:adenosylcobinamide-phosphate synthase